jgi:hypothetical protein
MKKYLLGTLAIALAIGLSSFSRLSQNKITAPSGAHQQTSLYWFVGTSYTGRQDTHAEEVPLSGCPDAGMVHCEDGYDGTDFNTLDDPNSGLKSGASINDFIRKS